MGEVTPKSSSLTGPRPVFPIRRQTLPVIAHDLGLDGHLPTHAK